MSARSERAFKYLYVSKIRFYETYFADIMNQMSALS